MFGTTAEEMAAQEPSGQLVEEVQALIGFEGTHRGMMVVRLPRNTACALAGAFVGEIYEEINEEVRDCAMEIVNILIGQLKASMAEHEANNDGFTFHLQPAKVNGRSYG